MKPVKDIVYFKSKELADHYFHIDQTVNAAMRRVYINIFACLRSHIELDLRDLK